MSSGVFVSQCNYYLSIHMFSLFLCWPIIANLVFGVYVLVFIYQEVIVQIKSTHSFFFRSRHNSIIWIRTNWVFKDSVSPIWVELHYGSKCFKINVTTCITKVSCMKTLSLNWIQVLSCTPYRADSHWWKRIETWKKLVNMLKFEYDIRIPKN